MSQSKCYYVVYVGRKPGIYTDWSECHEQTDKYEGNCFKKFEYYEEASKSYNDYLSRQERQEQLTAVPKTDDENEDVSGSECGDIPKNEDDSETLITDFKNRIKDKSFLDAYMKFLKDIKQRENTEQ